MSLTGQEKFETAPTDKRFPTTNQAKHCYTRYNEFYKCDACPLTETACASCSRVPVGCQSHNH